MNISLCSPPNIFQNLGTSSSISSRFIFVCVLHLHCFLCYKPHPPSEGHRINFCVKKNKKKTLSDAQALIFLPAFNQHNFFWANTIMQTNRLLTLHFIKDLNLCFALCSIGKAAYQSLWLISCLWTIPSLLTGLMKPTQRLKISPAHKYE